MSGSSSKASIDRNLREKHRRLYFKDLFARLASILPARASRASVFELIDQAINHIRQSRERIMMLSRRLEQLSWKKDDDLPKISVTSFGDELEVNMKTSESNGIINLVEVIHAIEEEGAEAISLSYSIVGGQLLGTIRSKAISVRIGIEISNVKERLRQLSFRDN